MHVKKWRNKSDALNEKAFSFLLKKLNCNFSLKCLQFNNFLIKQRWGKNSREQNRTQIKVSILNLSVDNN